MLHERIRALERRIDRLEACTERLEVRMTILIGLLVTGPIVLVAAPYLGIAVEPGGGGEGVP